MIRFSVVLLLMSWQSSLSGKDGNTLFETANQAYTNQDFESAIATYNSLLQSGYRHPDLDYNLGNAYYQTGKIGKAVLHYERAIRFKPNHSDAKHNLRIVQTQLQDEFIIIPPFFLTQWWQATYSLFSCNTWAILSIICVWIALLGWAFWLQGSTRNYKKLGFTIGIVFFLLALLSWLLATSNLAATTTTKAAIVVKPEASVHLAADQASTELRLIHEGTKVNILDSIGTWYKIALPDNATVGWISFESIEKI